MVPIPKLDNSQYQQIFSVAKAGSDVDILQAHFGNYNCSLSLFTPNAFIDYIKEYRLIGELSGDSTEIDMLYSKIISGLDSLYDLWSGKSGIDVFDKNHNSVVCSIYKQGNRIMIESGAKALTDDSIVEGIDGVLGVYGLLLDLLPTDIVRSDDISPSFSIKRQIMYDYHAEKSDMPSNISPISFDDIGGCKDVKAQLRIISKALNMPEVAKKCGYTPPSGVILSGPPGTGKTLLARAFATESGANIAIYKGSDLLSKWYGESINNVRNIFERGHANYRDTGNYTVVFIDEIDGIFPSRENAHEETSKMIGELLGQMDGMMTQEGVLLIGTTNIMNNMDFALLRPGRFQQIPVNIPGKDDLKSIYDIHLKKIERVDQSLDYEQILRASENYTGADVRGVINICSMNLFGGISSEKDEIPPLSTEDILSAIKTYNSARLNGTPDSDSCLYQ